MTYNSGFNPRPSVNRNGPLGNSGPQGPQGPTGPQGPAGPSGSGFTITAQTSNYSASSSDEVWCTGTFTVTLPATTNGNRIRVVNRGTGAVTIAPQSGTIIGNTTMVLSSQYSCVELSCDGTNWQVE